MDALICPQCGSGDLAPAGTNRFRCQHCGVSSEQNQANSVLSVLVWACPKCGFDNEKQSDFCGKCGHELTKKCLRCGAGIRWDLKYCPSCRFEYKEDETIIKEFLTFFPGCTKCALTSHRMALCCWGPSYWEIPLKDIVAVYDKRAPLRTTRVVIRTQQQEFSLETVDLVENDVLRNALLHFHKNDSSAFVYNISGHQGRTSPAKGGCGTALAIIFCVFLTLGLLF
jgi:hypothetical protein